MPSNRIVTRTEADVNSKSQFSLDYKLTPKDPFTAEVVKDRDKEIERERGEREEEKKYSYNELIKKDDLSVVKLSSEIPLREDGKLDITDIDVYNLGAVKGKKIETPNSALKRGAAVTEQSSLISSESLTISIAEFLESVKSISMANEIFSKDVAAKLGVTRYQGTLSKDLRFSLNYKPTPKDPDTAYIVEGWGEDSDTDTEQAQKPVKEVKETAEYKRLKQAESLWESAMEASGAKYRMARATEAVNDRADQNQEETETEDAAEPANSIDNQHKIQYNLKRRLLRFKRSLLHKNFPSETESQSEAHRLAVWWARKEDVQPGDQTLISMHNQWYIVERFEDADNGYQIEEFVKKSEFEKFSKEIKEHGRSGRIKSIQGGFDWYDRVDQQRDSLERRKSSADNDKIGYRGENKEMVRMAQSETDRGERSGRNGAGDREGSSADWKGDSVKSQFSQKRDQKYIEAVKRGDAETAEEKAARLKLAEETARRRNFNSEPRKAQAKANRTQRKV